MRNPVFDQAMRHPGLRRRMTRRVPPTNWLFGNLNIGGVLKIDGSGKIVDALWDAPDGPLYMITSMREHEGALYLGGVTNDKIGRLKLEGADRGVAGRRELLGQGTMMTFFRSRRQEPPAMTLEGTLGPNGRLDEAAGMSIEAPDALCVNSDGRLLVSSGAQVLALGAWGERAADLGDVRCAGHGALRKPRRSCRGRPRGRAARSFRCRRASGRRMGAAWRTRRVGRRLRLPLRGRIAARRLRIWP